MTLISRIDDLFVANLDPKVTALYSSILRTPSLIPVSILSMELFPLSL